MSSIFSLQPSRGRRSLRMLAVSWHSVQILPTASLPGPSGSSAALSSAVKARKNKRGRIMKDIIPSMGVSLDAAEEAPRSPDGVETGGQSEGGAVDKERGDAGQLRDRDLIRSDFAILQNHRLRQLQVNVRPFVHAEQVGVESRRCSVGVEVGEF